MTFALVALGAAVAVSVELLEALAIVLAVAVTRRWSDALLGAAGAVVLCAALAVVLGPVVLESVSLDALRVTIGVLLLLFGLEWLRKGTLRLAGRRSRSSSLSRIPETELKWGVGVLLSSFGVFFAAAGLGVHWPGSDAALLYVIAILGGLSPAISARPGP